MGSLVFDAHSHAFPDRIAEAAMDSLTREAKWFPIRPFHDGTVAGLVGAMDRAGIDKTVLCSVATRPEQVTKITDWSVSIASDRVIPFASVHPSFEKPEAEIERIASLGIRGLKFHPQYMACAPDDPRTIRIARAAARCGLAMTFHAGHDLAYDKSDIATPRRMRALADAVPDLRLLACHLGGWHQWDQVEKHLVGTDVYLDTSFCFGQCPEETLLSIVLAHSAQRLLFGTDSPWADPAAELASFNRLPISDDKRQAALWDNVHRFLGLV
jgi:predicted TIM-barrel fold metal-dependent hydrolase